MAITNHDHVHARGRHARPSPMPSFEFSAACSLIKISTPTHSDEQTDHAAVSNADTRRLLADRGQHRRPPDPVITSFPRRKEKALSQPKVSLTRRASLTAGRRQCPGEASAYWITELHEASCDCTSLANPVGFAPKPDGFPNPAATCTCDISGHKWR